MSIVWCALGALMMSAQEGKDSMPASSNVRGSQSPRVYRDGTVLITLKA